MDIILYLLDEEYHCHLPISPIKILNTHYHLYVYCTRLPEGSVVGVLSELLSVSPARSPPP